MMHYHMHMIKNNMDINYCKMIEHYGFLKQVDVSVNLLTFTNNPRFRNVVGSVTVVQINQSILRGSKNELMLRKAQGIYYFNRFNEKLSKYLKFSQSVAGAGIASITKFEQHK